jgi:hypothetical protein
MAAHKGTRPPAAGRPRKKGTLNKITRSAKQAFELAFEGLGGAKGLEAWGKKNKGAFYKIYARHFLPTNVKVELPFLPLPEGPVLTVEQATEVYRRVMGDAALDIAQVEFAPESARIPSGEPPSHLNRSEPHDHSTLGTVAVEAVFTEVESPVNTDSTNVVQLSERQQLWERLGK